ncbi:hypothetical protein DUI87_00041 [Hirundo rustica rustica]|uniref:Uncharacterized protein n=1 Tax=Hirundo rustica rustica TaxID=333673 RepID=A0A3M0LCD8_HIRRU|nr:hypothetical protein DUI87_00041 [Hirundo rustica rustica]
MTPQLFINYKLQSVAHLPWRMLTYKALNTFIDDLFAFVIKMPMMYRIGCLRDEPGPGTPNGNRHRDPKNRHRSHLTGLGSPPDRDPKNRHRDPRTGTGPGLQEPAPEPPNGNRIETP